MLPGARKYRRTGEHAKSTHYLVRESSRTRCGHVGPCSVNLNEVTCRKCVLLVQDDAVRLAHADTESALAKYRARLADAKKSTHRRSAMSTSERPRPQCNSRARKFVFVVEGETPTCRRCARIDRARSVGSG